MLVPLVIYSFKSRQFLILIILFTFVCSGQQHISTGATENTSENADRHRSQDYPQVSNFLTFSN